LDGIPPAMRGIPQIEVTFDIDANGIINVSAMDKGTNKTQNIRIEASSGLSKEEIEKMKQEAEANAESDKKAKEDAEVLNLGDTTIFQIEKSLKDLEEKITEEQKSEVTSQLEELKDAHSNKDVEKVKEMVDKINTTFQNISMNLYQQAQDMAGQTTNEGDAEVTDVDFEEVEAK
jgi:molecular chaperone DnaK